jgi:hypothetical protein
VTASAVCRERTYNWLVWVAGKWQQRSASNWAVGSVGGSEAVLIAMFAVAPVEKR